jgi:DNA-binding NtrC family response regulator
VWLDRGVSSPTETDSDWLAEPAAPDEDLTCCVVFHPERRHAGTSVRLPHNVTLELGRDSDAFGPAVLADARLSTRHASLRRVGDAVEVVDLGSRNGVRVGSRRVARALVEAGTPFALGRMILLPVLERPGAPCDGGRLVGRSSALREVVDLMDLVARRDTTVLVVGETGTGKELVAEEIHARSGRSGAFVPVNCSAIAPGVLQSELFGHVRGAFSGADRRRTGLVAAADGGTLFLDEIGDASLELQKALLRLLEQSAIRPVGADRTQHIDVRIVAATHRDLAAEVDAGRFRPDLLNRLYRWVIPTPALRERPQDIPLLVSHFARRFAGQDPGWTGRVAWHLLQHRWPGNVRELEARVEALVVLARGGPLDLAPGMAAELAPGATDASAPVSRPDRAALARLLSERGGNMRGVATAVGVSRNTLYRWCREDGLIPDDYR